MLQTVELAKLKCTVTMGTLGEKKKKKINNEIQKKAETICTFKILYFGSFTLSLSKIRKINKQDKLTHN